MPARDHPRANAAIERSRHVRARARGPALLPLQWEGVTGQIVRVLRHIPEALVFLAVLWVQFRLSRWLLDHFVAGASAAGRRIARALTVIIAAWVAFGLFGNIPAIYRHFRFTDAMNWIRGYALAWAMASVGAFLIFALWRRVPQLNSSRRGFIRASGTALVAAPFAVMGFGIFVERKRFHVREVRISVPNLPKDLDGLRIAQLSDIHLSAFLSEQELAPAIDLANELKPHLTVVTGDLISTRGDPLDACIRQIARLKADAGVLGCLGNHEIFAGTENATEQKAARIGVDFLRQRSRQLRFGSATLNISGVDYQKMGGDYLVGAERLIVPGATNILLSHNSDVFDAAASQGWDVTLSGHTHGGQVTVEILKQTLNAARFFTPYVYGLYRQGPSSIWVTRGIGTIGVPARLGAPPEVALIRLCAT